MKTKSMNLVIAAAQSSSVPGDVHRNVAHHLRIAARAADQGAHLLVFPELSLTGYELALARANVVDPESPVLDPLRRLAADAQMTVVVGAPVMNEQDELNITALIIGPDGTVLKYTKEYVHESEQPPFTSGLGGPVLRINDTTIALAICRDASFPEHAGRAAARAACVYAVGVMITEEEYGRKAALLKSYALDHKMAVLLANYSGSTGGLVSAGKSRIWSEDAEIVAESTGAEEALIIGRRENGAWTGIVSPIDP